MDGFGKNLHISGHTPAIKRREPSAANGLANGVVSGNAAVLGAEAIGSHYVSRRWTLRSDTARNHIHLLSLDAGTACVQLDGEAMKLSAPSLVWLPAGCAEHLEVAPGASAHLLRMKSGAWHRYVAPTAEHAYGELADIQNILAMAADAEMVETVSRSVATIAVEIATPARGGAASIISAELTLCMLRFWRLIAVDAEPETEGGGSAEILNRFRRLVEERYHQQLRVSDYARLIGVTADRLHALCTRVLQRSPSALIQQRLMQQAVARLESSNATVKQIAFALGFKDTAYFSRFFRKHAGASPAAWRRGAAIRGSLGRAAKSSLNFADWP